MARFLKRRERLPLSVVGWPTDGADDGVNMATSGSLSERYFPDLRTRSRHTHQRPPTQLASILDGLDAGYRRRTAVLQFVRRERRDSSFLISSDLILECTDVKMRADNLRLLIDSVRAVISDGFYNKAAFLGRRLNLGPRTQFVNCPRSPP
jgi:hypothetical protein